MSVEVWIAAAVAGTALAAPLAYRIGYRRARPPFPEQLRADLRRHKRECLGEPVERVEQELLLFLGRPRRPRETVHEVTGAEVGHPAR